MNEFEAIINSLGAQVLTYVGKERLTSVTIWGDERAGTADIALVLQDASWASQEYAVEKMIEVRSLFIDDVSIDYRFLTDPPDGQAGSTKSPAVVLSVA